MDYDVTDESNPTRFAIMLGDNMFTGKISQDSIYQLLDDQFTMHKEYRMFKNILQKMFIMDPALRPSADDLLKDDIFKNI